MDAWYKGFFLEKRTLGGSRKSDVLIKILELFQIYSKMFVRV